MILGWRQNVEISYLLFILLKHLSACSEIRKAAISDKLYPDTVQNRCSLQKCNKSYFYSQPLFKVVW